MLDLKQRLQDEQIASVKIVMLEELISVMNKGRFNWIPCHAEFDDNADTAIGGHQRSGGECSLP